MADNRATAKAGPDLGQSVGKQPTLEQIMQALRGHMPELRQRYAVRSLGVFGSYVRGQQRKRSDLDILVEFERAPSSLSLPMRRRRTWAAPTHLPAGLAGGLRPPGSCLPWPQAGGDPRGLAGT